MWVCWLLVPSLQVMQRRAGQSNGKDSWHEIQKPGDFSRSLLDSRHMAESDNSLSDNFYH